MFRALILMGLFLQGAGAWPKDEGVAEENDGRKAFKWEPVAVLQIDLHSYPNWELERAGRMEREEVELRRLRAGVEGAWRNTRFELEIDPFDDDDVFVKDARIELRFRRSIRLRVGHFKLPGGREYHTSSRRIGFLERSPLSGSLSAGRDLGAQVELRLAARVRGQAGLFAGDGLGRQSRGGITVAARGEWEALDDLDLGFSGMVTRVGGVESSSDANGINGRSASGYRFFDRLYARGRRTRIGADARWSAGPWQLNAEVMRLREERHEQGADYSDLPALMGRAFTVSARWVSGRGEIGLRYGRLTFDDEGPTTGLDGVRARVADVRARGVDGITASAGWHVTPWLAVLGEASAEEYSEATSAPDPSRTGPYWTLGLRLQLRRP